MKTPVFFIGEKLSSATRQWLVKQHVLFIEEPFFRTEYKKPNLAFFKTMAESRKQWVITSSYAAHWLVRFHAKIGLTVSDRLYCWSEKQAEILKKLNRLVFVSSYSNPAELAENVLTQNEGDTVLFLRGDVLHNELTSVVSVVGLNFSEIEVYKNTPVEKFFSGIFDAYLFFNPQSIENFKASGNFTSPNSLVLANESSTAKEAWRTLDNKVYISPEHEELPFVQDSFARWVKENK